MVAFVWHKFIYSFLVLWGTVSVVFLLFFALPGDPSRMMLDQREDSEQLALIQRKFGFDLSLGQQYLFYLNDLSPLSLHQEQPEGSPLWSLQRLPPESYRPLGQWGVWTVVLKWPYLRESFARRGMPVSGIIAQSLPNTAVLALSAMLLAMSLGLLLGSFAAAFHGTWWDRLVTFFSTLGMSVPSFFSAIIMAWVFGFLLSDYTGLNMTGSLYEIDDLGRGKYLAWSNLILPALTLGIRPLAVIVQLTRSSLLDELGQDYIRTARAKGLSAKRVWWRHAMRNALNPVITAASGWLASMLAGAVFVEYIFGWNGIGKQIVEALNQLDLPVVMGAVLAIALIFVLLTIAVDLIYAWLDPRVRS